MIPIEAYWHAFDNYMESDFDLNYYQEIACKNSELAFLFADHIPGADIEYCQEHACKEPKWAYYFARDIPGADLQYCRKTCRRSKGWLDKFDKMIIKKVML